MVGVQPLLLIVFLLGLLDQAALGGPVEEADVRVRQLVEAQTVSGAELLAVPLAPPSSKVRRAFNLAHSQTTVHIPDGRLRGALEEALEKDPGAPISRSDLASLRSFSASRRRIVDLTGLEFAVNLTYLNLSDNGIREVSQLSSMTKLSVLWLSGNPLYDVSPLSRLAALEAVHLRHTNVRDLSLLTRLPRLNHLSLAGAEISDLSPLLEMSRLNGLQLDGVLNADLEILSGLTQLTELSLARSGMVDPAPLASLRRLQWLTVLGNPVKDLSPLSGLTELRHLDATDALISDLSPLSTLRKLRSLALDRNAITNIAPLSGLVELFRLDLAENDVSDLSPLRRMTSLSWLFLQRNVISDLSPLSGLTALTRLEAWDNDIADLGPLVRNEGLGTGGFVRVFENPLNELSIHTHVPALRERGVAVLWESHFSDIAWYRALPVAPRDDRDALGRDDYFILVAYYPSDLPLVCEGTLEVDLDIGGEVRQATTGYGRHLNFLALVYVVREDDLDADGLTVLPDTFRLVEGECSHADGSPVRDVRFQGGLPTDDPELRVDGSLDMPTRVRSVSVSPPAVDGTFARAEPVVVRVEFDEPVAVEGLPGLRLRVGNALRTAVLSTVERSALQFEYRVAAGEVDSNGIAFPNPLQLAGGSVRDMEGNVLALDVPPTHDRSPYPLRGDADDTRGPVVADVSVKAWRDRWPVAVREVLRQNDRLQVRIAFDEYVEAQDAATLHVGIGQTVRDVPLSAVRGDELRFEYVVRAADVDTNGITIAADALALPGNAAIRDGAGNIAKLDLGRHAVPAGASYRVRGSGNDVRPTIVSADFVRFTPRHGIRGVGAGESILFVVRYDEPVWVHTYRGSPTADVRLGAETRTFELVDPGGHRHFRPEVVFAYVVRPSDALALQAGFVEADYTGGTIALNGGRILDRAGNSADLTWPPGLHQHWWRVDGFLPVPDAPETDLARLPYAAFAGNRGPDRSFGRHEVIDIPVRFSEPVSVAGEPTLPFRIGDAFRRATYVARSGDGRLLFRYRVQGEDIGALRLPAARLLPDGGSISGSVGQAAGRLIGGVPALGVFGQSYFVNGVREPDTPVPPVAPPSGVRVAAGPGELVVSWDPLPGHLSGGIPVTAYRVIAHPTDGGEALTCRAGPRDTCCVVDGPLDATEFAVTVLAENTLGAGYASTVVLGTTEPLGGFWRGWRRALPEILTR